MRTWKIRACVASEPNHNGRCCCNCINHLQDFSHCTTVKKRKPGQCVCSNPKGWICTPMGPQGPAYSGWSEHGICEMHEFKAVPESDP